MSEYIEAWDKTAVGLWLEQLVGCDCDDGWRLCEHSGLVADDNCDHAPEPCDRCVLVGIPDEDGIRMRVNKHFYTTNGVDMWLMLPALEVADE